MYVCICNAVTDRQIRKAAREGCHSLRMLSAQTGCATTCGKCSRMAREILDEELQRQEAAGTESAGTNASLAYPAA